MEVAAQMRCLPSTPKRDDSSRGVCGFLGAGVVGCGVGEPRRGRGLAVIMKKKDLGGEARKEKPQRSSGPGACGCNSSPAKQLQGRLRSSHTALPHLLSQTSPTKAAFPTIASPTLKHCQICAPHSTRSWPAPRPAARSIPAALQPPPHLHVGVELGTALRCLPASSPCPRVPSRPCTAACAWLTYVSPTHTCSEITLCVLSVLQAPGETARLPPSPQLSNSHTLRKQTQQP